jgi:hypothetical protein
VGGEEREFFYDYNKGNEHYIGTLCIGLESFRKFAIRLLFV